MKHRSVPFAIPSAILSAIAFALVLLSLVSPVDVFAGADQPVRFRGTTTSSPRPAASAPAPASRGWPAPIGENWGTPVLCDLNGDGIKEVIAEDQSCLYAFDSQGTLLPGWPRVLGEALGPVAVADIDEDGVPEIIAAISSNPPGFCVRTAPPFRDSRSPCRFTTS